MKSFMLALFFIPSIVLACPNITGVYKTCHSEIKPMKGEFKIDQSLVGGVEKYEIQYTSDVGDIQNQEIYTDGRLLKTKQTIPTIGIKVNVEGNAICDGETVISNGKAFLFGINVGNYSTILSREGDILVMKVKAQYLGQTVLKLIECKY